MWNDRHADPVRSHAEQGNSVMSNNANDSGNGFKNSRIDLSQLGDDNWNKPFTGKPAAPGMPKRRAAKIPGKSDQPASLDELFESRVHAATAERAVNQNRGQSRIWLFAGGLFLASLGGIAAAYYLVGPPMALSTYGSGVAGTGKVETASLLVENNVVHQTSSHFQGITIAATAPVSPPMASNGSATSSSDVSLVVPPLAGIQPRSETVLPQPVAPELPAQQAEVATIALSEQKSETDQNVEGASEPTLDASSEPKAVEPADERMVHIVPTAVSGEPETKTNVNVSKLPAVPKKTIGQWLAVPAETEQAAPSTVMAAASQQSTKAKPEDGPVKTQQELFKSFQAYLESTGHAGTINHPGQKALFNKFIRWSVEAPIGN